MTVDVVILSKCGTKEDFEVNENSLRSLMTSEPDISFDVIIIESNSEFFNLGLSYTYSNIRVVCPNEPFRFNRFLNIGLELTKSEWVCFSNNDVTFHKGWLSELFKVKEENPAIQSFCPFDRTSPYLTFQKFNNKRHHIGYRVPIEFVGWCHIIERCVFEKVGRFDEQFDLYFGDNDFALTLKKNSIVHAMVPSSFVEHKGGYTTKNYDASGTPQYDEDKARFTKKWKEPFMVSFGKRVIRFVTRWLVPGKLRRTRY